MSSYVKLKIDLCDNHCIFLVDSGATISTIKKHVLRGNTHFSDTDICTIRGVGSGTISTLSTASANISVYDYTIKHNFQIVSTEFPVPGDGILGLDFLKKNNCRIDYQHDGDFLFIRPHASNQHDVQVKIPITDSPIINTISKG